jgi:hypothetical protein
MLKNTRNLLAKKGVRTFIFGLFFFGNSLAVALPNNNHCQIAFSLKGDSQAVFEQQVDRLSVHIRRLNIELLDLNKVQNDKPYVSLSGRDRRRLKHQLDLVEDQSSAFILFNRATIFEVSGGIDLTLLLQVCEQRMG